MPFSHRVFASRAVSLTFPAEALVVVNSFFPPPFAKPPLRAPMLQRRVIFVLMRTWCHCFTLSPSDGDTVLRRLFHSMIQRMKNKYFTGIQSVHYCTYCTASSHRGALAHRLGLITVAKAKRRRASLNRHSLQTGTFDYGHIRPRLKTPEASRRGWSSGALP